MAGANTIEFTSSNFQSEALEADAPVLVDFWAPWCAPCRAIGPAIDAVADRTAGSAKVGKVNVDEHPDIAAKYGVQSIPTILVLKGGEVVETFVGIRDEATLTEALEAQGATAG
jgi:thioredoxin 1